MNTTYASAGFLWAEEIPRRDERYDSPSDNFENKFGCKNVAKMVRNYLVYVKS
jgi:hypothetical protein